jgi:hypothetical protein
MCKLRSYTRGATELHLLDAHPTAYTIITIIITTIILLCLTPENFTCQGQPRSQALSSTLLSGMDVNGRALVLNGLTKLKCCILEKIL